MVIVVIVHGNGTHNFYLFISYFMKMWFPWPCQGFSLPGNMGRILLVIMQKPSWTGLFDIRTLFLSSGHLLLSCLFSRIPSTCAFGPANLPGVLFKTNSNYRNLSHKCSMFQESKSLCSECPSSIQLIILN